MEYLPVLMSIAVVQLLGAASPGPTFVMVSSHAIGSSRRHGLLVACGVLISSPSWALMAAAGVGIVVSRFPKVLYRASASGFGVSDPLAIICPTSSAASTRSLPAIFVAELQISAADLGLLTSVYFRVFAAAQLPSGSQQFVAKQQHDRNGSAHEIAAAIAAARAARSR